MLYFAFNPPRVAINTQGITNTYSQDVGGNWKTQRNTATQNHPRKKILSVFPPRTDGYLIFACHVQKIQFSNFNVRLHHKLARWNPPYGRFIWFMWLRGSLLDITLTLADFTICFQASYLKSLLQRHNMQFCERRYRHWGRFPPVFIWRIGRMHSGRWETFWVSHKPLGVNGSQLT